MLFYNWYLLENVKKLINENKDSFSTIKKVNEENMKEIVLTE